MTTGPDTASFARRVVDKVQRVLFRWRWRSRFAHLGANSTMVGRFRLDGGKSVSIGDRVFFQRGAWLYAHHEPAGHPRLRIGDRCVFGYNNHFAAVRSVEIGDDVLTANNVYVSDNIHGFSDVTVPIKDQPVEFKGAVSIGAGTWLGENVCIIGARVGRNCVVGANAVVTRDIPDYSVAVGVPAVVIRQFDGATGQWRRQGLPSEDA